MHDCLYLSILCQYVWCTSGDKNLLCNAYGLVSVVVYVLGSYVGSSEGWVCQVVRHFSKITGAISVCGQHSS